MLCVFPARSEETGEPRSYHSLQLSAFKARLATLEENDFAATFGIKLTTAVLKYRTIDEFFAEDTIHFNSLGIRPNLSFVIPTYWDNLKFVPSADLSLTQNFELGKALLAASASIGLHYNDTQEKSQIIGSTTLTYGTRHDMDGLNLSDYLRIKVSAQTRRELGIKMGKYSSTITPFASFSYFIDELVVGVEPAPTYKINREFEFGFILSTIPRVRIWKVKMPKIQIGYVIGEDFSGIKIRI